MAHRSEDREALMVRQDREASPTAASDLSLSGTTYLSGAGATPLRDVLRDTLLDIAHGRTETGGTQGGYVGLREALVASF